MKEESLNLKQMFFGKISRKLTFLFFLVGILAPSLGIFYFYSIANSFITQNQDAFLNQHLILETTAFLIILLIAIDTAVIGYIVSKSISKPIEELHNVAQELEKGNFDVKANIATNDEIKQLGLAFNDGAVALAKMDDERKQLDRAKSEFLSITSHELRTPITPLKAQLQMLKEGYFGQLNEKQKQSLTIVLRCTERLNKLIEDFLEISRIEVARLKFSFRKTNLNQLITNMVVLMQGFAQTKEITLQYTEEPLPEIEVDPDRVSQVLRNLIHNAIKFSPKKSTIEIKAIPHQNYIQFSVKDSGVGMSPDDKIRVFEPFFQIEKTLNREHGGTGLGLAICRGIIESQRGKIWADSTLKKGSTFYFTIPCTPVKEIEPIKVLFSPKTDVERRIKDAFNEALGPMGHTEYKELMEKNSLNHDDLFAYIESLQSVNVLDNNKAGSFKTQINHIFANQPINQMEYKLIEICKR